MSLLSLLHLIPPPFVEWENRVKRCPVRVSVRACASLCVRPSVAVGILCAQLLLQIYADRFETLQEVLLCSEDVHVVWL